MPLRDVIRTGSLMIWSLALASCQSGPSSAPEPPTVAVAPVAADRSAEVPLLEPKPVHRTARLEIGPLVPAAGMGPKLPAATPRRPDQEPLALARLDRPEQTPCDPGVQDALALLDPVVEELRRLACPLDADRLARLVEQIGRAAEVLRPQAALTLASVRLVRQATGFGLYEPCEPDRRYRPGAAVDLYVEVRNFTTEPADNGEHRVGLESELMLTDTSGSVLQTWSFATNSPARSPRHDFSQTYCVRLPGELPQGHYQMRLRVRDRPTGRTAEAVVALPVTGAANKGR